MAPLDVELARKVGRIFALAIVRFDPTFCGKVLRIAAVVSVVELLSTIALLEMWIPANSVCLSGQTPTPAYGMVIISAVAALWLCVLTIFWKRIAKELSAWEESQRGSKWLFFFWHIPTPVPNAVLVLVFCGFALFVAVPFILIIQDCGSKL